MCEISLIATEGLKADVGNNGRKKKHSYVIIMEIPGNYEDTASSRNGLCRALRLSRLRRGRG